MQTESSWSGSFKWHLEQVPFQLMHMRELAENTLAAQDTSAVVVSGTSEKARLPYRVDPADDADLLYATLIIFGREVAEKIGGASPRPLRARMWSGRDEPQGLPLCTPSDAFAMSTEIIRWLIACTHQIAHDATLNDAPESLIDLIREVRGRYPRAEPKFRAYRRRPCPTCGERLIHPTYEESADEPTMRCDGCRDSWPWKDYLEA
ncbi:hypothetical protein [Leucobacter chromiiresistens]|uniref:Uncharacterized protein n=1 Tax=Leucobacter chromiiresistens TaxID=1079994 RepID=A0A1H0XQL3_9MICO|nr:hypothetical protein [Leucobacter chromiiresistens]SDQ05071.1 hypothetical protein SAMN04488565_0041 [Leucobacter chromiiresistens]SDQ47699.1 hypothetical protein SAMN04488565_2624 [Leucobacter chromiiresistens]